METTLCFCVTLYTSSPCILTADWRNRQSAYSFPCCDEWRLRHCAEVGEGARLNNYNSDPGPVTSSSWSTFSYNIYRCHLEKAMAPHSSTLAWKIPWTEEPGGLQSMGSLRVRHDWATSLSLFTFHFNALEKEMATHSSILAWRIPGTGEPGGLPSMGSHRVGHDWSDLAAAAA